MEKTYHSKYQYIKTIVESGMPVRLCGEAGTGKSTIAMQLAEDLGLDFASLSMTKQTTLSHIIGFVSIQGTYIPTNFRKAYEEGSLFLLDEIDAGDPNTLLCLNSIENGYMSFPDGIIHGHPDFRLIATSNPDDEHSIYTGRSKLDFATKDRFFTVDLPRDSDLEIVLTSAETVAEITRAREVLEANNSTRQLTMRDSIRYHKMKALPINDNHMRTLIADDTIYTEYITVVDTAASAESQQAEADALATAPLNDAVSVDTLYEMLKARSSHIPHEFTVTTSNLCAEIIPTTITAAKPWIDLPVTNPSVIIPPPSAFIDTYDTPESRGALAVLKAYLKSTVIPKGWEVTRRGASATNPYAYGYTVETDIGDKFTFQPHKDIL